MAITRLTNSGFTSAYTKYDDMLAGYPPAMAAPTATDGGTGTTVSVAFTAVTGATGYRVISSPGSITATGLSSPITVSGLTTGTAYTFQVQAQNSIGYGGYSAASNSVTPAVPQLSSVEALVVAGGGGSGSGGSGGGGAGGLVYYATQPITIGTTYSFTIGAGARGTGSNSTAFSMTANGGGSGGSGTTGGSGGSGGGNWYNDTGAAGSATQGNSGGGTGYGNAGGPGTGGAPYSGGRGGGAGSSGASGGSGRSYFGSTYAAGGAGGSTGNPGSNGTPNTGNGGNSADSNGGSGVVIIRYSNTYADAVTTTGSPTYSNSGGYKTYTFTGSGSIKF